MSRLALLSLLCAAWVSTAMARGPLSLQTAPGVGQVSLPASGAGNSATCVMCTFMVDRVKVGLNDTSTQATILQSLLKMCTNLPADLVTECTDLVRTYEPVLCQFVVAADSAHLCTLLGACETTPPRADKQRLAAKFAAAFQRRQGSPVTAVAPNDSCDVCKMTVIEAHSLVTNPAVQANLLNYTKTLCAALGDAYTQACQEYIDIYAPALFDLLEKFLASDELCIDLGICTRSSLVKALGSYLYQSWASLPHITSSFT